MSVESRRIRKIVRKLPKDPFPELTLITDGEDDPPKKTSSKPVRKGETVIAGRGHTGQHLKPAVDSTPRVVEGMVTLTELATERNIQAQLARLWVIQAGIAKKGPRWMWKEGSRDLQRARKALGLPA